MGKVQVARLCHVFGEFSLVHTTCFSLNGLLCIFPLKIHFKDVCTFHGLVSQAVNGLSSSPLSFDVTLAADMMSLSFGHNLVASVMHPSVVKGQRSIATDIHHSHVLCKPLYLSLGVVS